jgi:adenylosuccinate lyase
MISRYQDRKIKEVWSKSYKYHLWEKISLKYLNCILKETIAIKEPLSVFSRVAERQERYERETRHEFVAFLKELSERLSIHNNLYPGPLKYLHYGLTSSDVIDTAFSLQIRQSINEVTIKLQQLIETTEVLQEKTSTTTTIGRTHGKHAERMLFSSRFKLFKEELKHSNKLLDDSKSKLYGKMTGPVGTSSHVNAKAAKATLEELDLLPAPVTTQIVPRFYYTDTMYALTTVASALERMATQIRLMAIDEINEVQEGFTVGQAGSSAMPHKNNPILSEKICGLSRIIKNNFLTILNNNNLWFERDISHSSVERIVWPETFHLTCHTLENMDNVLNNLNINYDQIIKNLKHSNANSHEKLLKEALVSSRFEAYPKVQNETMNPNTPK